MTDASQAERLLVAVACASNRSIAGSSWDGALFGAQDEADLPAGGGIAASELGLDASERIVSREVVDALAAWGVRIAEPGERADFTLDEVDAILRDPPARRSGQARVVYARAYMPCIRALAAQYGKDGADGQGADGGGGEGAELGRGAVAGGDGAGVEQGADAGGRGLFAGVRIGCWLIIEPKTAVLLHYLREMGAEVALACGSTSVDADVLDALRAAGIRVYADADGTQEGDRANALRLLDEHAPEILLDDGAALSRLAFLERPALARSLRGICEETTSGVAALEAMEADGTLLVPAVAVNDAAAKTRFDNAHGTGETVLANVVKLVGSLAGQRVLVSGYGPVGRGLAKRCRAAAGTVEISEVSPVAALEAMHDGFRVRPAAEAAAEADLILSASGVRGTVGLPVLRAAKPDAVVAVAGGTWQEVSLADALAEPDAAWDDTDKDRCVLTLGAKHLTVLSGGHGVNYTSGGGNSIETMDLSFAAQLEGLAWLLRDGSGLPAGVHRLPAEVSERIVALKLASSAVRVDAQEAPYDWRLTKLGTGSEE
ncbi:MAG: adenosylhomocysteinase [Clostridiales Family XIII bacterium]|jgi:adenosylhomocysteinase|nr:adenosylhomocysteinase [Clostridiales Family XIII bacterium]